MRGCARSGSGPVGLSYRPTSCRRRHCPTPLQVSGKMRRQEACSGSGDDASLHCAAPGGWRAARRGSQPSSLSASATFTDSPRTLREMQTMTRSEVEWRVWGEGKGREKKKREEMYGRKRSPSRNSLVPFPALPFLFPSSPPPPPLPPPPFLLTVPALYFLSAGHH